VLKEHGFTFSKALGQNFLINPSVCPKMAELCGASEKVGVIEVGPGAGVLTNELAAVSHKVVAVELDKRLLPVLDEKGDICDIQINYSESYAHQMLRYSSEYGTLI
jgi:16S rRNA (adenine1518-N6/adenine1519-N6)-dimethyltransferase